MKKEKLNDHEFRLLQKFFTFAAALFHTEPACCTVTLNGSKATVVKTDADTGSYSGTLDHHNVLALEQVLHARRPVRLPHHRVT